MSRLLKLYITTGLVTAVTVGLGLAAYHFFWFWHFWWFDVLLHLLAGLSIGLISLSVYVLVNRLKGDNLRDLKYILSVTIIAVAVTGIIWELLEFQIDQSWATRISIKQLVVLQIGFWDTIGDLVWDLLGAVLAGLIFYHQSPRLNPLDN